MAVLHVGLVQALGYGADVNANLTRGLSWCHKAHAMGVDFAVFPELWSVGYDEHLGDDRSWPTLAVPRDGEFVNRFREAAAEAEMAVAVGFLEEWNGAPRNSVAVIDSRGELVYVYAKVHTCDFDFEAAMTPGDKFIAAPVATRAGEVTVGAMVCFDREFPESARELMLAGAEVIVVPNACRCHDPVRLAALQTRAYENMAVVAMANYAAPQQDGRSVAYSPVVYDPDGRVLDPLLVQAGRHEGIYIAPVDLEELRAFRATETQGDAYRKPDRYRNLCSPEGPLPPFLRGDSRRSRSVQR